MALQPKHRHLPRGRCTPPPRLRPQPPPPPVSSCGPPRSASLATTRSRPGKSERPPRPWTRRGRRCSRRSHWEGREMSSRLTASRTRTTCRPARWLPTSSITAAWRNTWTRPRAPPHPLVSTRRKLPGAQACTITRSSCHPLGEQQSWRAPAQLTKFRPPLNLQKRPAAFGQRHGRSGGGHCELALAGCHASGRRRGGGGGARGGFRASASAGGRRELPQSHPCVPRGGLGFHAAGGRARRRRARFLNRGVRAGCLDAGGGATGGAGARAVEGGGGGRAAAAERVGGGLPYSQPPACVHSVAS
eukprot:SAG25_NODE_187_length_12399_cov_42.588537_3_plen_303_part_00